MSITKERIANFEKKEPCIIHSHLEIWNLVNYDGMMSTLYINFDKGCIEDIEDFEGIKVDNNRRIKLPSMEELCPYNASIREFIEVMEIDIPENESASHYLRRNELMTPFYVYRHQDAVIALIGWLKKRNIEIVEGPC